MIEFFRGWRRKIGLLTLLMASLFMAGWNRSLHIADSVDIQPPCFGNGLLHSHHGNLDFYWKSNSPFRREHRWRTFPLTHFSEVQPNMQTISYLTIAIPLTVLSAILILTPPGKPVQKIGTELVCETET